MKSVVSEYSEDICRIVGGGENSHGLRSIRTPEVVVWSGLKKRRRDEVTCEPIK